MVARRARVKGGARVAARASAPSRARSRTGFRTAARASSVCANSETSDTRTAIARAARDGAGARRTRRRPRGDGGAATTMGYVPPHLRGAGGASDGGGGRARRRARASGTARDARATRATAIDAIDRRRTAARSRRAADGGRMDRAPVFATWRPSARVEALTEAQTTEIRERLGVTVEVEAGEPAVPSAIESFEDMTLARDIMADIRYREYDKPSPIQAQAIPVILSGRDVLGCAETGSGKTAAFSIPMIQHALNQAPLRQGDGPYAIVMAPTRELAQQIEAEAKTFTRSSKGFRTAIIVGGTNMSEQRGALRSGVQIVVATPGRLIDHLQQGNTNLSRVSFVVLDEADRMLDMGFEPQIREVLMNLPKPHQTLLFSATMPSEVEALASDYLQKPVKVKVGTTSAPTANVSQHLEKVVDAEKVNRLVTDADRRAARSDEARARHADDGYFRRTQESRGRNRGTLERRKRLRRGASRRSFSR